MHSIEILCVVFWGIWQWSVGYSRRWGWKAQWWWRRAGKGKQQKMPEVEFVHDCSFLLSLLIN